MQAVRSILYVPSARRSALERACRSSADALIYDLEDAVAPDVKTSARELLLQHLSEPANRSRLVAIRINGAGTPWFQEDLGLVNAVRPQAVLIPKVESSQDVAAVESLLESGMDLWAMIETPRGVLRSESIAEECASAGSALKCLVMGLNDLSSQTHAKQVPHREPMLSWLSHVVLVARAHGLLVIDGVYNALQDAAGLAAECEQACRLGFDGKTLIHPDQVNAANVAFTPSLAEVAHARSVVEAFTAAGGEQLGAVALNGQMVERLHLAQARRVLAMSGA